MVYDWPYIIERAWWTMLQAFLSAFPVATLSTDLSAWKAAALSGLAAAGAALISLLMHVAREKLGKE